MKKKKGKKPNRLNRFIIVWGAMNLYLSTDNPAGPVWTSNPPEAFHFPTRKRAAEVLKNLPFRERASIVPRVIDRGFPVKKKGKQ